MAHLKQQFKDALSSIEPGDDKEHAPEAHQLVREALETDSTLVGYGIDTTLIGSYKRNVSIKRIKDVDVFSRLPDLPSGVTSHGLLDHFFKVLNGEFGTDDDGHRRTKRQDRSLQVTFPEFDLYVDAVPARPYVLGEGWEIPQRGDDDAWVRTNPEALTSLSSEINADHDGLYVPTVKLMRQTRRALIGKSKPGGFFMEVATYEAFKSGVVTGADHAEYYAAALAGVSNLIDRFVLWGVEIPDPTLPGRVVKVRASEDELDRLRTEFAAAAVTAAEALDEQDEGKAALAFQSLLGKNGDGESVFPVPPGFDEDGTKRASVLSAGARTVPAGKRTFG
jgi:hypothetical protein